jgi:hypothetical protein
MVLPDRPGRADQIALRLKKQCEYQTPRAKSLRQTAVFAPLHRTSERTSRGAGGDKDLLFHAIRPPKGGPRFLWIAAGGHGEARDISRLVTSLAKRRRVI